MTEVRGYDYYSFIKTRAKPLYTGVACKNRVAIYEVTPYVLYYSDGAYFFYDMYERCVTLSSLEAEDLLQRFNNEDVVMRELLHNVAERWG